MFCNLVLSNLCVSNKDITGSEYLEVRLKCT